MSYRQPFSCCCALSAGCCACCCAGAGHHLQIQFVLNQGSIHWTEWCRGVPLGNNHYSFYTESSNIAQRKVEDLVTSRRRFSLLLLLASSILPFHFIIKRRAGAYITIYINIQYFPSIECRTPFNTNT